MPSNQRPLAWEDDFSRNSLDLSPFSDPLDIAVLSLPKLRELFSRNVPERYRSTIDLDAALAADRFPLPGNDDREGYSVDQHEWFWLSGLVDWLKIQHGLHKYGLRPRRVLEMGAATGRVLRHLSAQGRFPEIWAMDLNQRHVRWVSEFLDPQIRCFHNHALPHLPIADGGLDLVCAFSVFTHIDTFETAWIAELYRVLGPGGVAWISFQTEHTWDALKHLDSSDRRLNVMRKEAGFSEDMIWNPMPVRRVVFRHTQIGPYRGMGFHHSSLIRESWGGVMRSPWRRWCLGGDYRRVSLSVWSDAEQRTTGTEQAQGPSAKAQ